MQLLSDTTRSDGYSELTREDESVENASGWNDELSDSKLDLYLKNKKLESKLINLANERFSLANVFKKYELNFKQQYSPSGWTHKSLCPFKDHNEQTPSFSYNPQEDRFYCFGCQRGGKIVQFISYMEDKSTAQVARDLLKSILPDDEILSEAQNEDEQGKIFEVLVSYAKYLSDFTEKHNNDVKALKYAEIVTWPLDCYVRNHLPNGTIVLEQLLGRIAILKEYLESYGDNE